MFISFNINLLFKLWKQGKNGPYLQFSWKFEAEVNLVCNLEHCLNATFVSLYFCHWAVTMLFDPGVYRKNIQNQLNSNHTVFPITRKKLSDYHNSQTTFARTIVLYYNIVSLLNYTKHCLMCVYPCLGYQARIQTAFRILAFLDWSRFVHALLMYFLFFLLLVYKEVNIFWSKFANLQKY